MQLPSVKKPSLDKVSTPRHSTASISPLTSRNNIVSPRSVSKPTRKDVELIVSPRSVSKPTRKNLELIVSPRAVSKSARKDLELSQDKTLPCNLTKVALSFKNWSDSRISWSSLPSTVRDLGKVCEE